MSCKPIASTVSLSSPLIVPFVPTATKFGVSMMPWRVWIRPTRAREIEERCRISNTNVIGLFGKTFKKSCKRAAASDDCTFDSVAYQHDLDEALDQPIKPKKTKERSIKRLAQ